MKNLFKNGGREISLYDKNRGLIVTYKGFIQPLRYKNKMYLDGINTEIGFNSQGHYLYIGPPEYDLTPAENGRYLVSNGISYQIDRAEKVYYKNEVCYIWAIIRTIVEEVS